MTNSIPDGVANTAVAASAKEETMEMSLLPPPCLEGRGLGLPASPYPSPRRGGYGPASSRALRCEEVRLHLPVASTSAGNGQVPAVLPVAIIDPEYAYWQPSPRALRKEMQQLGMLLKSAGVPLPR